MPDTQTAPEEVRDLADAMSPAQDPEDASAKALTQGEVAAPTLKVIIAVHGVGDQLKCQTVQSVAERFSLDMSPPLPLLPLGYFNVGEGSELKLSRLDGLNEGDCREHVYFAEVYWAGVPRKIVKEADTLEDAKAWGKTVVSRARALYQQVEGKVKPVDLDLAAGAVEEIVETVHILENLLGVLNKAGIFKFDLAPLLRDYVGDVQVVAEFPAHREAIVSRFQEVLSGAHLALKNAVAEMSSKFPGKEIKREIYIVAHSEGTVVAYLGLLRGLSTIAALEAKGALAEDSEKEKASWIDDVRGFMTIGSPIDKHLILWRQMWKDSEGRELKYLGFRPAGKIKWRNYADLGDPIGFELNTARHWMTEQVITAFEFDSENDMVFSRYLLPGKAHVDYWKDEAVFGHFINDVVMPSATPPLPPGDKLYARLFCAPISYSLSVAFHAAAVYFLYTAVASWDKTHVNSVVTAVNVALLTFLLCGVTFAARLPRLVKRDEFMWQGFALLGFALGAAPLAIYGSRHTVPVIEALGSIFNDASASGMGVLTMTVAAFFTASSGWWARRRPRQGRRWLVSLGALFALVLAVVVIRQFGEEHPEQNEAQPVWPVLLGLLAFVYSWWVGILTFDLAFLWHRYVRGAVAKKALDDWNRETYLSATSDKGAVSDVCTGACGEAAARERVQETAPSGEHPSKLPNLPTYALSSLAKWGRRLSARRCRVNNAGD